MEYDERPRGRVLYNTVRQQFTMMADRCILRNKRVITKIRKALNLPDNTKLLPDRHYRCPKCLREKNTRIQDWDL